MSKSLAFLSTFLLVILTSESLPITSHQPNAVEPSIFDHMPVTEAQVQVARNSIILSMREVSETKQLVVSFSKQKRLWSTERTNQLQPCVESLISNLASMKFTLQRLQQLNTLTLNSDIKSLVKMMAHAGTTCRQSVKNDDKIVPSMLTRKLDNLSAVIYDVVYHVSMIKGGIDGSENGGNA